MPKKKKYELPDLFPASLNVDAWKEMVEHREEQNNPYTPLGAKKAINKLIKYPHNIQQLAIDRSIEGGWTGVFPESVTVGEVKQSFVDKVTDRSWAEDMPYKVDRLK